MLVMTEYLLDDGPARLSADGGVYDINQEVVTVDGELRVRTSDGYALTANGVSFNLESRMVSGEGGVEGSVPAGTLRRSSPWRERTATLVPRTASHGASLRS